ncbi:MAG: metallophosphoesterase [Promethearchaeota archaeon]
MVRKITAANTIFIVNPNLGHPKILSINKDITTRKYSLELLFITNMNNSANLQEYLIDNIGLVPILNFEWKVKKLIEERGFKKKAKEFWIRIKNLILGKKLEREYEISLTEYGHTGEKISYRKTFKKKELKNVNPRTFRIAPLDTKIQKVEPVATIQIDDLAYLKDQYCNPQRYLLTVKAFQNLNHFYKLVLEFSLNDEIIDFLSDYNYVMFDIMYKSSSSNKKINYHSLVITKNEWQNINIFQITDLHLAKRNDEMVKKVEEMYKNKKFDLPHEKIISLSQSFKKRLINPNNLFRSFIKIANGKVLKNEIDFIFITGDIVDFTISSNQSPDQEDIFNFEMSNWLVFKEIILHINLANNDGIEEYEELMCPIYTIPGNHDYRPWQYDLSWGGLYKKVGLKKLEAQALKEEYLASPIKAILKSDKALEGYLREINASLDYFLKFGSLCCIFLNTGADSYRKITDFVRGNPSLTGINKKQVKFLENIINFNAHKKDTIILSIHGPPINTPLKRNLMSRIKRIFKKEIKTNLDQFKESNFRNVNDIQTKARIDDKFNVSYGTISTNLEKLIDFCYNYVILTISGHTHILNEFRLEKLISNQKKMDKKEDPNIAIYYDDYSKIYKSPKDIKRRSPFIVQTPALGFKAFKKPGRVGGFREIKIRNSKLSSFKVSYINQ